MKKLKLKSMLMGLVFLPVYPAVCGAVLTQDGLHGLQRVGGAHPSTEGLWNLGAFLDLKSGGRTRTDFRFVGSYGLNEQIELGAFLPLVDGVGMGLGDIGFRGRYLFPSKSDIRWGAQAGFDLPSGSPLKGTGAGFNVGLGALFTWDSDKSPVVVHADARFVITGSYKIEIPLPPGLTQSMAKALGIDLTPEINPGDYLFLGGGVVYKANDKLQVTGELAFNALGRNASLLGGGVHYAAGPSIDLHGGLSLGLGSAVDGVLFLLGASTRFGAGS